jgi:hypothetical protein
MEAAPMTEPTPSPDPEHPECPHPVCQTGEFGPSHDGSSRCRNAYKSIAAGGEQAHCTCRACF